MKKICELCEYFSVIFENLYVILCNKTEFICDLENYVYIFMLTFIIFNVKLCAALKAAMSFFL